MSESTNDTSRYQLSLKSSASDELLNTHLIRPLAWLFVRPLLRTPLRPEWIVVFNIALATGAALFFLRGSASANALAGVLILAKTLFDGVDGQLARAKGMVTRLGRFLDSLGDFYTNLLIFLAIGIAAARASGDATPFWLWLACFWVMTLQCSYFNYYLVAHLTVAGRDPASRIDEGIRPEDEREPRAVRALQKLYLWTYGWQDSLIAALDGWLGAKGLLGEDRRTWYTEAVALRISSFLGLGTLLTPLGLLALLDRLDLFLLFIFGVCNLILLASIAYRARLARRLLRGS